MGPTYIIYGPLSNKATTVMFEGVPNYPDFGRFWEIVEKHNLRVNLTKTDDFRLNFDSFDKENIFISRYKEIIMENFK